MKKIAKLLKADINATSDLAEIAAMLASKGRGKDTILAHITPKGAQILKDMGGSGTTNPTTGLLEFSPEDGGGDYFAEPVAEATPVQSSGEVASQQFPDYGPALTSAQGGATTSGLPFTTGGEQVYAPVQTAQAPAPTVSGAPYVATSADRAALYGDSGYGAKASPTELAATAPPEKSFLDKLTKDLTSQDMIRLGLAGGLGTLGYAKSKQAQKQAEAAKAEQQALGAPYQTKGKELVRAAEAGELTPTGQQALQATQARIAQGVEARGGVGAQQAAAQVEAFRQQLLQQQYNYGLQVAQIGDSIALGAIRTGLQADNAVQQATQNFYTNLAMVAGGIPMARG